MKLLNCNVYSFGGLKNFKYDFNDNLNTIKEDNGFGKSTLSYFIKAMFYGLADSKRNIDENERRKFKPWLSTEKFGGTIDFLWGEKTFRIERLFGTKETEDELTLKDLETGKFYQNTQDLGKRIFDIDEEGFFSTTYFAQKDFEIKSNTSLTAKYNALFGANQDSHSFDVATQNLDKKIKEYKKTGDKGLIADKKREIFFLEEKLNNAIKTSEQANSLKQEVTFLKNEIDAVKTQINEVSNKISQVGKQEAYKIQKQRYDTLSERKSEKKNRLNQLNKELNCNIPSESQVAVYRDCYKEYLTVKSVENALASKVQQPNSVDTKKDNKKLNFIMLISMALIFCLGAVLSFVVNLLFLSICAISIIILVAFLIISKKNKNNNELNNITKNNNQEYLEYKNIRESYQAKLDEFFSQYSTLDGEYDYRFTKLSNMIIEYNSLLLTIKELDKEIKGLNFSESFNDELQLNESLPDLKQKLSVFQNDYAKLYDTLAKKNTALNFVNDAFDNILQLESSISEAKEMLAKYQKDYEVYSKTLSLLKKADENLKIKYRKPLEDSLNKYFTLISQDPNKKVAIDVDMKITVLDNGKENDTAYYSKGYKNLFEICKRFALTDILFTGEKPFIMLDDPFTNLDDEKLNEALNLIKELSKEYQILYFVCHESRRA